MDKLPPELLLHIIQLASPAATPTPSAFRVRSAALRSFALVASIWRDIAQSELLSCIVVQTAKQVALLQDTLEAKGGHGGTTQLWIGGAERTMHEGLVVELLGVCKGVQQLWLSTINGLALEDLAGCKDLEELHCYRCVFVELDHRRATNHPSRRVRFPGLHVLHLDHCQLPAYPSPTDLPNLVTLSLQDPISNNHLVAASDMHATDQDIDQLSSLVMGVGPHLVSLTFGKTAFLDLRLMHHMHLFTSLRFLDLASGAYLHVRLQLLDDLPALTVVRIRDRPGDIRDLSQVIDRLPTRQWKVVVVVSGAAPPELLALVAKEGVEVKSQLEESREGKIVVGPRVGKGEEWVNTGFWSVEREVRKMTGGGDRASEETERC